MNKFATKLLISITLLLPVAFCSAELQLDDVLRVCSERTCYEPQKMLGAGAFGQVYQAVDTSGKTYAIKKFRSNDKYIISDAEKEYRLGSTFNSDNIIKSFDLFSAPNEDYEEDTFVVLEYVPGKTIWSHEIKRFNKKRSIKLALQLLNGLQHAYRHGLIHVDLHGGNIMISRDGKIKIVDLSSFVTFQEIADDIDYSYASTWYDDSSFPYRMIAALPVKNVQKRGLMAMLGFDPSEVRMKERQFKLKGIRRLAEEEMEEPSYKIPTNEDCIRSVRRFYVDDMVYMISDILELGKFSHEEYWMVIDGLDDLEYGNLEMYSDPTLDFNIVFRDLRRFLQDRLEEL